MGEKVFNNRIKARIDQRVKFFKDGWCGDVPLGEPFSMLFSILTTKDA